MLATINDLPVGAPGYFRRRGHAVRRDGQDLTNTKGSRKRGPPPSSQHSRIFPAADPGRATGLTLAGNSGTGGRFSPEYAYQGEFIPEFGLDLTKV
ncbi:MAG: hypothetical protein C4554_04305 [Dethiobacter sp.]|nr:MAG: hypothetical protein C4554_04305 [Dethiobacter sp.]